MGRHARDNRPRLKPVKPIELDNKNKTARIIALAVCIVIAIASFTVFLVSILTKEDGFTEIKTQDSVVGLTDELVLTYRLGLSDKSPTAEHKEISAVYSETLIRTYKLLNCYEEFSGYNNLFYISQHAGEEIETDRILYDALKLIKEYDENLLYLQPIYQHYESLFMSDADAYAKELDPYFSSETQEYFDTVLSFATNREHISIELLEDYKVKLTVSEAYRAFALEENIGCLLGIANLRNAFIIDEVARALAERGYTDGSIVSCDGYMKNLDAKNQYSYNIFDVYGTSIYTTSKINYTGDISLVTFRNYSMSELDLRYSYNYGDGRTATLHLDVESGKYKASTDTLYAYSYGKGVAETALMARGAYVSDSFIPSELLSLTSKGIQFVFAEGLTVRYTDKKVTVDTPYEYGEIKYDKELLGN